MEESSSSQPSFSTAINCMDGRVQLPVTSFACHQFKVDYVDMVTGAGAVAYVDEDLLRQVGISLKAHQSRGVVVAAHQGCAGNPIDDASHQSQCLIAAEKVRLAYPGVEVVAVWVCLNGDVDIIS